MSNNNLGNIPFKKIFAIGGSLSVLIVGILLFSQITSTVQKGTYQIKQAAVTGDMSAKMTPGLWLKLFGGITTFPKAETFYFTADKHEGARIDESMEVRFADGSMCDISGTLRILLPADEQQAIEIITEQGYLNYKQVEQKLIKPTVRNVLRLTANLMSARESYSAKRSDFIFWAGDQIQHGLYETSEEVRKVKDPVSGELVTKTFKIIKRGKDGIPLYQQNPLEGLGIKLANFEIKSFVYADKVRKQIDKQQEALMAVETARAKAKEAEQSALTVEAEGKANVMKAKYEQEREKAKAIVQGQKEKELAELKGQKQLAVAKLDKETAKENALEAQFKKQEQILLGEGEAKRKKLVMQADGALKQKLDAWVRVNEVYAKEFSKQKWTPEITMGGSGTNGNSANDFMNILMTDSAKRLALDMKMKK